MALLNLLTSLIKERITLPPNRVFFIQILCFVSIRRRDAVAVQCQTTLPTTMTSPIDRLNELPPLPRRTPKPRRAWRYLLVLVALLLVANSILGERGLVALFQVSREHTQLRQIIETLHEENNRLHRYVQALTIEPRFLENEARRELGMIKPGEQLFLIKTIPPAPVTHPTLPAPSSHTAAN